MDDLAPGLLEKLRRLFLELLGLEDEPLTAESWPEAYAAAERVGDALARAFGQGLSGDALPDGRMYWNIADRVARPLLEQGYTLAADAAEAAQQALNAAAGLGLRAVAAPVDSERINGILNRLAAEQYEDVAWLLNEPVRLLARAAVDDTVRRNVEFQGKAGLRPRVVRRAEPDACKWCRALAGSYDYPDVPKDVYRRHENCRCRVEYDPRDGRRQDVWGKRWTEPQDRGILEERKTIGLDPSANVIQTRINRGEYSLQLSRQEYLKHVLGTPKYEEYRDARLARGHTEQSRLSITEEEAQALIRKYAGKGIPRVTESGEVVNVEYVSADYVIGQYITQNGEWKNTSRFAIHYNKKSSHIVPIQSKKDE